MKNKAKIPSSTESDAQDQDVDVDAQSVEETFSAADQRTSATLLLLHHPEVLIDPSIKPSDPRYHDPANWTSQLEVNGRKLSAWRVLSDIPDAIQRAVNAATADVFAYVADLHRAGACRFLRKEEEQELRRLCPEAAELEAKAKTLIGAAEEKRPQGEITKLKRSASELLAETRRKHFPECFPPRAVLEAELYERFGVPFHGTSTVLASCIADQTRQILFKSEFSDGKLAKKRSELLSGAARMPWLASPPAYVRADSYELELREESVDVVQEEEKPRTRVVPIIYIHRVYAKHVTSTPSGYSGPLRLVCRGLVGRRNRADRSARRLRAILDGHVKQGTLQIRRSRCKAKGDLWHIGVASTEKVDQPSCNPRCYVGIHRGVANMLTMVIVRPDKTAGAKIVFRTVPGEFIVQMKRQMAARRGRLQQDIADRWTKGRSRKYIFRPLRKLQDKEARFVANALQTVVAQVCRGNPKKRRPGLGDLLPEVIVCDDFAAQMSRGDDALPGYAIKPYIENFPYGKLREVLKDFITSKLGLSFTVVPSYYLGKTCPACGVRSEHHSITPPKLLRADHCQSCSRKLNMPNDERHRAGWFRCSSCHLEMDLDRVAAINVLFRTKRIPESVKEEIRAALKKLAAMRRKMLDADRHQRLVEEAASTLDG